MHTHKYNYMRTHIYIDVHICTHINIHILTVKSIWSHSKVFISHPKGLILMKQVKPHSVFIDYTEYKSS